MFTLQPVATLVESDTHQAASQHGEDVRACGEDLTACVMRKRTVEAEVVDAVRAEVRQAPLVATGELGRRVKTRVGREDLTVTTREAAVEPISCQERRRVRQGQGEAFLG
jgi:hypothetical protein